MIREIYEEYELNRTVQQKRQKGIIEYEDTKRKEQDLEKANLESCLVDAICWRQHSGQRQSCRLRI